MLNGYNYNTVIRRIRAIYLLDDNHGRVDSMEGIRGIAVLLVFLVHLPQCFEYGQRRLFIAPLIEEFSHAGNAGVDLFFCLSGFLIYRTLIEKPIQLGPFVRRRVERIYPTFLVVFLFYLVVSLLIPSQSKISGGLFEGSEYVLENLVLLPGVFNIRPMITIAWSLSFEMFFYLALPIAILLLRLRYWKRHSRILFLLCTQLLITLYFAFSNTTRFDLIRMVMFVSGLLWYEASKSPRVLKLLGFKGEVFSAGAFILAVAFWKHNYYAIPVVFPVFCFYVVHFKGFLSKFIESPVLRALGNMSYSYYLVHSIPIKIFHELHLTVSSVAGLTSISLLALASTWLASTLLFVSVEKPFSLSYSGKKQEPSKNRAESAHAS